MGTTWEPHGVTYLGDVTSLAFDPFQELLWTGTSYGRVVSYFLPQDASHAHHTGVLDVWSRYTAFRGHMSGPTKELIVDERGVLSLGERSVKLAQRTGRCSWQAFDDLLSASTMCYSTAKASELAVGGAQSQLVLINTHTATTVRKAEVGLGGVSHLQRSQSLLCCGDASGTVGFRDPRTLKEEQTINAHLAGLTQMEAEGNLMITAGFSLKHGNPIADPLVKVFDLRMFRALGPLAFPAIPAFIRFHPRTPSTIFITSSTGQLQLVDLSNPSSAVSFTQLSIGSYLADLAIASTGEALAYSDADGSVHLYTSTPQDGSQRVNWSRFGHEVELPDNAEPLQGVDWTRDTPLSSIGMPFYDQELCSVLPEDVLVTNYSPLFQPRPTLDPEVLAGMRVIDQVGYATNPRKTRRYQATPLAGTKAKDSKRRMSVPLFRSEKDKENERLKREGKARKKSFGPDDELDAAISGEDKVEVPKWYRQVEIKYSRFGIEDFDFGFYNRTTQSGLETHIANSYTNSLLQVLYHTFPLRRVAESHIAGSCATNNCILCELGFLFKILDDARGVNCQATNFLRAFAANPRANSLDLMDTAQQRTASTKSYSSLIQLCHHFLLEQFADDVKTTPMSLRPGSEPAEADTPPAPMSDIFGMDWLTVQTCPCGHSTSRASQTKVIEFVYPRRALSNEPPPPGDLPSIFRASLIRETTGKLNCPVCGNTTHQRWRRVPASPVHFPPILALNAAVTNSDQLEYWVDSHSRREGRFLQPTIGISTAGGLMIGDDVTAPMPQDESTVLYDLQALIVQIQAEDDPPHLVSLVKVAPDPETDEAGGWYLFNDFLVRRISEDEALSFPGSWKIPAILYYSRRDAANLLDLSRLSTHLDTSILMQDMNLAKRRDPAKLRHELLQEDEIPKRGTLVAIDAEFVSLQQEEVDYKSDGTRNVRRPSRMTLARVSVVRGEGPKTGVPFLDDHIQTNEPVADYLTEFSGIRHGDLDIYQSRHTVVSLKSAYKKLRLLVDLGCVFIGHGLSKDFRIINIYVPPEQIIDTVNLYFIPSRQRKLSLRFLSFVVLHHDIQNAGMHDSIEDARTALQLYEVYSKLLNEGRWEDELEEIYREGRDMGWKVPVPEPVASPPAATEEVPQPAASRLKQLSPPPAFYPPGVGRQSSPTPFFGNPGATPSFVPRGAPPQQQFQPFGGRSPVTSPPPLNRDEAAQLGFASNFGPSSNYPPAGR